MRLKSSIHHLSLHYHLPLIPLMAHAQKQTSKRLALVFGNSDYYNLGSLPNAMNDAKAVKEKLHALGFEVSSGYNLEKLGMLQCIHNLLDSWKYDAREIVIFYTGHGVSIGEIRYDLITSLISILKLFSPFLFCRWERLPLSRRRQLHAGSVVG